MHGHENAGLHHKIFIQHAKLLAIAQLTYRINLKTKQLQIKFCSMAALVFSLEDLESVVPEVLGVDSRGSPGTELEFTGRRFTTS